jgi:hypothetical protein
VVADGFVPLPFAAIEDLNAVAESCCPECERPYCLELKPHWKGAQARHLVHCHWCQHQFEF